MPEDYKAVRDIVADIVSEGVQVTTSQTTRQTVKPVGEAIKRASRGEEDGASVKEVADILKLDVSTASRRFKVCLKNDYLRNLETRRGRPYKLVVGDPLPTEAPLLPCPESLAGCGVAVNPEDVAPPPPSSEPPPGGFGPEIEEEL